MHRRRFGALVAFVLGAVGCHREPPSPVGAPSSPLSSAPSSSADAKAPTAAACEELWSAYHAIVPEKAGVDHDGLVARCVRSEPAVLGCVTRTKAELEAMFADVGGADAGPAEPVPPRLVAFGMATRIGACVTRERLRFALRTGELDRAVRELRADPAGDGPHGTRVLSGAYATLPWRGVHERDRAVEPAPEGEVRVVRKPDGRVWIYFLGALLGRHQNQIGFLYASAPFVPGDFTRASDGPAAPAHERVCLGAGEEERDPGPPYMIRCFGVGDHLSPQLVEVGAAPD